MRSRPTARLSTRERSTGVLSLPNWMSRPSGGSWAGFEMAHGTIEPGGTASRHQHETEWQVFMLLEGEGRLELGTEPPQTITAGAIVRIPPRTPHLFEVTGDRPVKLIVIYSPPLGEHGFVAA